MFKYLWKHHKPSWIILKQLLTFSAIFKRLFGILKVLKQLQPSLNSWTHLLQTFSSHHKPPRQNLKIHQNSKQLQTHQASSSIIKHHQPCSSILSHHQNIFKHFQKHRTWSSNLKKSSPKSLKLQIQLLGGFWILSFSNFQHIVDQEISNPSQQNSRNPDKSQRPQRPRRNASRRPL